MEIREKIVEGAAELFKNFGIKSVTMDSLATHLGMSKRTIYEIFSDKDDLLAGVLKWMNEKQNELLKHIMDESENAVVAIFRLLEINQLHFQQMSPAFQADIKRFHYELLIKKVNNNEILDYGNTRLFIERGIKENLFKEEINTDLVNRCLYLLGRTVMDNDLFPFELFSRREVIKSTFINYLKGISTPSGLNLINILESDF